MNALGKLNFNKLVVGIMTALVLVLLILAGPAQALSFKLDKFDDRGSGQILSTTASINVNANERVEVDEIILEMRGHAPLTCTFDVEGNPLTACDGISLTKISGSSSLGYGYGDELVYTVLVDSSQFEPGNYNVKLRAVLSDSGKEHPSNAIALKIKGAGGY